MKRWKLRWTQKRRRTGGTCRGGGRAGEHAREELEEERTVEQRLVSVVEKLCDATNVTLGLRRNGAKEQQLHAFIMDARVDVLLEQMKARVKEHVAAVSATHSAAGPLSV